ncbi:MAG: hypothetical protein V7K57_09030 [Nostoc sp.]
MSLLAFNEDVVISIVDIILTLTPNQKITWTINGRNDKNGK